MVNLTLQQRRLAFYILLGVAGIALLLAILATVFAWDSAGTVITVAVVLLVLALAGEILLLVLGESKAFDEKGEWYDWEAEARATEELLLRCASCRETFTVHDTGERPLRHACPHCGKSGVLRDKPAAAPQG